MAEVVLIATAPSRALYEAVDKVLGSDVPAGCIVHTATEEADGTVRVVDVWESREAADAFERDLLMPAFETVMAENSGGAPPPDARPEYLEPFHVLRN